MGGAFCGEWTRYALAGITSPSLAPLGSSKNRRFSQKIGRGWQSNGCANGIFWMGDKSDWKARHEFVAQ